jgi:uncharacterized protein
MILRAQDVRDSGPLDLEETISAEQMPLDSSGQPSLASPLSLKVHAEDQEGNIWVRVVGNTSAHLQCARCAERFDRPIEARLDIHLPPALQEVDVTDEIRQSVILALPVKPLCRPDCRGLCDICGKNLNQGSCNCRREKGESPFTALKDLKLN